MLKGLVKEGVNTKSFQVDLKLAKSNKFELLILLMEFQYSQWDIENTKIGLELGWILGQMTDLINVEGKPEWKASQDWVNFNLLLVCFVA